MLDKPFELWFNRTMTHLTEDQILDVLRAARDKSARDQAMVTLAYLHGLRASEVCTLKVADVDMANLQLTVQRLKGSALTVQPLVVIKGEPLLNEPAILRKYLAERRAIEDGSDYLFLSVKGGAVSREHFTRLVKAYCIAASLARVLKKKSPIADNLRHAHALKHSIASHLVGRMDLFRVKQFLGHKSINSTMIYTHGSDTDASSDALKVLMDTYS